MSEKKELSILKKGHSNYPSSPGEAEIESFENPSSGTSYTVEFSTGEFTSLCPITSQPDFGRIKITYSPDKRCIESKSLKLYLFSYRNHRGFAEKVVNRILNDLAGACSPQWMKVEGEFTPRGGLSIKVQAEYASERG